MSSPFLPTHPAPHLAMPVTGRSKYRFNDPIDYTQVPALLWLKSFMDDHEEFYARIQHISDYMNLGGPSLYSHNNPNTPACKAAYRGDIDMRDYQVADAFYGKPGSAKIRDFGFYHSIMQRNIGNALQQPLKFTYRDVSPTALERRMKAMAQMLNESKRRQIADALSKAAEEAGTPADFSFMTDPEILIPEDGIYTAPTHSVEERAGHALLVDTIKRHRTKDELRKIREDAMQVNARMAHILSDRRGTRPVRLDSDYVHWISPVPIVSDRDCDAIGTWEYLSMPEILNRDGHYFPSSNSARPLQEFVEKLRSGHQMYYNPRQYQFRGDRQLVQAGDMDSPLNLELAMWQEKFYPGSGVIGHLQGETVGIMCHQLYFKMIRYQNVRVLINGKTPTQEKMQEFRYRNYDSKLDVRYEPMDDDEKAKRGEFFEKIPIINLWQARRYGHNTLVDVKRCTHVPQFPSNRADVRFPIVIQVSRKRSMVALGLDFRRMWNLLWNRIEEQLNLGGAESALLIDTAQVSMEESKSLMWQAKKTAVIHYNSTRVQDRTNQAAANHLKRVQLTSESNTVNNMLSLAGLLKQVFEAMVGDPGQAGPYDSGAKLGLVNSQQGAIGAEFDYEDNLFHNDTLQRTAEIQKTVAIGDEWTDVSYAGSISGRTTGKKASVPIYIPKTIKDVEPLVEVDNGARLLQIQKDIEGMAAQTLPSGGASGIREFIRLKFEDDPTEALAIFDTGMNEVEKAEAAAAKAQQENAAQRNEVEAKKAQIPIEVAKIKSDTDILIAQGKFKEKQYDREAKGDMSDVQEVSERERMMLAHELESGRDQQQLVEETGAQQSLNQQQHQQAVEQQTVKQLTEQSIYPSNLDEE